MEALLAQKDARIAALEAEVARLTALLGEDDARHCVVESSSTSHDVHVDACRSSALAMVAASRAPAQNVLAKEVLQHLLVFPWLGRRERSAFAMASARAAAMRRSDSDEKEESPPRLPLSGGDAEGNELVERLRMVVNGGEVSTSALWSLLGEVHRARRCAGEGGPAANVASNEQQQQQQQQYSGRVGGGGREDTAATATETRGTTTWQRQRRKKTKQQGSHRDETSALLCAAVPVSCSSDDDEGARSFGTHAAAVTGKMLQDAKAATTRGGRLERELIERRFALTRLDGQGEGGGVSVADLVAHNRWLAAEEAKLLREKDSVAQLSGGSAGSKLLRTSSSARAALSSHDIDRIMAAHERFNAKLRFFRAEKQWFHRSPSFCEARAHVLAHFSPVGKSQVWMPNEEEEPVDFVSLLARMKTEEMMEKL